MKDKRTQAGKDRTTEIDNNKKGDRKGKPESKGIEISLKLDY